MSSNKANFKPAGDLTAAEIQCANHFSNDPEQLDEMQIAVAEYGAQIANNLDEAIPIVNILFDELDQKLENYLVNSVSNYDRWNLMSGRTCLLSKIGKSVPSFSEFIHRAFGVNPIAEQIKKTDFTYDIRYFIYEIFTEEMKIRKIAEDTTGREDIADIIEGMIFGIKDKKSPRKYNTDGGFAQRGIIELNRAYEKNQPIIEISLSLNYTGQFEASSYYIRDFFENNTEWKSNPSNIDISQIDVLEYFDEDGDRDDDAIVIKIPIKNIVSFRKNQLYADICNRISEFQNNWDSFSFFKKENGAYKSLNILERKIIDDIIASNQTLDEYLLEIDQDSPKDSAENLLKQRLGVIDKFVQKNPQTPVSSLILEQFPKLLESISLESAANIGFTSAQQDVGFPTEAPVKWRNRREVVPFSEVPGQELFGFIRAVYGKWLDRPISKQALRRIDPVLINELNTWIRDGNELPHDINIRTVQQENNELLNAGPEAVERHLQTFTGQEAAREAARLKSAAYARERKNS